MGVGDFVLLVRTDRFPFVNDCRARRILSRIRPPVVYPDRIRQQVGRIISASMRLSADF